jgi:hypothetical protein
LRNLSNNDPKSYDLSLDFFSKTFIRKDRNNSGGGLLIYFKDDIFVERVTDLENDGGFELYVPGPGCVSTSPIIRINCNTYNRKTILISGIVLCRRNRDKTRAEHRKLINIIQYKH